ncbi:hypothetical protein N7447_004225 [Penicillium robsamsonii]|uniref:uncharacterized protein n=1 Tax=Penicillium robsamsonii TaxID=1792511 RepID=UPI002549B29F|nr:uncharacterized protein N7447_004225 [Penicillium robsamsonii]KAJ5827462.1 hypothetical protein N7447_004225 [Penicillium robsamsonii]
MASNDRKYRLSYEAPNRSMPQEWQPSGCHDKSFGSYHIVRSEYNAQEDWYCKHRYYGYPGAESYHCVNLTGWYYSLNPDGSEEKLHMKQKRAAYHPPNSLVWEDWSDIVAWDKLPAIPDRCLEKISRPAPWFWAEFERREQQRGMAWSLLRKYIECCENDVFHQGDNDPHWNQHSEWDMPIVNEDVMFRSASETSVKSEGDTPGGSSTDQTSQEELPKTKVPTKKRNSTAAECTSVKSKPRHRRTESSEKEPEEPKNQKRQKKAEINQAGEQGSPRLNKMKGEKRKFEEQESQEGSEGTKLGNKKHKNERILEAKRKETGRGNSADLPNRKRKVNDEDGVVTTPITVKKKRRHSIQESAVAIEVGIC